MVQPDLPIAAGILAATGQIPPDSLGGKVFVGELSLNGETREIPGVMAIAAFLKERGESGKALQLILPRGNAVEAALPGGIAVRGVSNLLELAAYLKGELAWRIPAEPGLYPCRRKENSQPDFKKR